MNPVSRIRPPASRWCGKERQEILIIAGEASGDLHGAQLAHALSQLLPHVRITGVGGSHMRAAGVHLLSDIGNISVVGIWEGVKVLGELWTMYRTVVERMTVSPCVALILIDFPELNFRLARAAKKQGIPVLYYIAPQVWAWRQWRVRTMKRIVDKVFVILPFEVPFYQNVGIDVEFVGHPLLDRVQEATSDKATLCRQLGLDLQQPIVGLLPGSRRHEIDYILPVMLQAAERIRAALPTVQFILPLAQTLVPSMVTPWLGENALMIRVLEGQTYAAMQAADFLIVTSGTATLEAGLFQTPMVIVYRGHPLSALIVWFLLQVRFAGLVNLLAGEELVPELLQFRATPKQIAQITLKALTDPARLQATRTALGKIRTVLGTPGVAKRTAQQIVHFLHKAQRI
jgi:lipid-A-disaccharide synthase